MSVDYELVDPVTGEPFEVSRTLEGEGGTYMVGGWNTAELNVTYNYGAQYKRVIPDYPGMIGMLHGKTAEESIPMLRDAIGKLSTERSPDYWEPTEGNARHALEILLSFAEEHPNGKWVASG